MPNAKIFDLGSTDQTIVTNETEATGQHLVTAGAVVRINKNNLVSRITVYLILMTKAEHVLGKVCFTLNGVLINKRL